VNAPRLLLILVGLAILFRTIKGTGAGGSRLVSKVRSVTG
jgi:hypothetical protein